MAGVVRIELTTEVLETHILPLNYTPFTTLVITLYNNYVKEFVI